MASTIGSNHGIEATRKRLQIVDPATVDQPGYDRLLGEPGKVYPSQPGPVEGTVLKLVAGHNEVHKAGGIADRVDSLAQEVANLPFPFGAG